MDCRASERERADGSAIASRGGPRQQHDLATEAAGIDAGMDLARGREGQSIDHHGMDSAVAQLAEQRRDVGLERLRMRQSAIGDAVPRRVTAAEQNAHRAPQLEPSQAEARGEQTLAANGQGLRPIANEQPTGREAGERAGEMCAANRIERGIDPGIALAPGREPAHGRHEIVGAIVDPRRPETLDGWQVRGRTGADRLEPKWRARSSSAVPTVPEAPITRMVAPLGKRPSKESIW